MPPGPASQIRTIPMTPLPIVEILPLLYHNFHLMIIKRIWHPEMVGMNEIRRQKGEKGSVGMGPCAK